MAYTSYQQGWLEDPAAIRIVLVQATVYSLITSTETTLYFSSSGYVTTDGVTFVPSLLGKVSLNQSISPDGGVSMSFGDLEFANHNGEYDDYLDYTKWVWSNRSIKVYFGDPGFQSTLAQIPTNFSLIFDGIIDDVDSRSNKVINLKVRNKLERLNAPITENKIGTYGTWAGGQTNQDTIKPLVFGECFNITPVLVDPSTLEYLVCDGAIERIIEIRDNGVPIYCNQVNATSIIPGTTYTINTVGTTNFVSIGASSNTVGVTFLATGVGTGTGTVTTVGGVTPDLANGKFKLLSPASGTITCTVQGIKTNYNWTTGSTTTSYTNTITNLISTIVTQYGKASTRFTYQDLDSTNFTLFDTNNNTQEFGIYVTGGETVIDVCQKLASSLGSEISMNSVGKLQLLKFGVAYGTSSQITQDDIMYNSLVISNRLPIKAAVKLGYAKNWTVQTGLMTAIPDQHKENFATEWLTTTSTNSSVQSIHKLDADPNQKDTYLISTGDASPEATRLIDYYSTQRTVFKFTAKSKHLSLTLGQPVTLTHPRFGLSGGKSGQVISLSPDWLSGKVEVEVIV